MSDIDTSPAGPARRWAVMVVLVIGLGLAALPFAFGMFTKAPKGATMMSEFKPFMTTARLDGFQQELAQMDAGVKQTDTSVAAYFDAASTSHASFDNRFPTFATFDRQWPAIDKRMTTLMDAVQSNLGNYLAISALPSFRLFPWFFVFPGALLVIIAGLILMRPRAWRSARWALAVLGVALIAAPAVFQMFGRAPDGGQMMTAFKTIETTQNVETIQGYFSSMAEGQGAIRLNIVPALEASGLSADQAAARFPAVATLDAGWIHMLNDMTPMIGAMSDNVVNYQAVESLPPFPLFPWFFVIPGLLAVLVALLAGSNRSRRQMVAPASEFDDPVRLNEPHFAVQGGVR
jgi:hypothetical protein